ncbi:hypothetical protein [Paraflavitalea speifideaquila]|uniref:hypothetical protein n=1 Tax=Paraflavitalea speifideaquila TaxID=3076558 RepID=UPI0028E1A345|nr:hypothetical protein [Paraflavitalea speifideiaquila]
MERNTHQQGPFKLLPGFVAGGYKIASLASGERVLDILEGRRTLKAVSTSSFRPKVSHPATRQSSAAGWPNFYKVEGRQAPDKRYFTK